MEDFFLIKQVIGGNQDAFRFLVLRYQRPLFKFLSSFHLSAQVMDEIAQETFLRAYKNLTGYDSEKGASFSSWLFVIAKNLALNEIAKHHRKNEIFGAEEISTAYAEARDTQTSVDQLIDENLSSLRVTEALKTIPLIFRTALTLSYLQELSLEEAATIEGCSVGTIKSRVFRGKNLLRLALGSEGKSS